MVNAPVSRKGSFPFLIPLMPLLLALCTYGGSGCKGTHHAGTKPIEGQVRYVVINSSGGSLEKYGEEIFFLSNGQAYHLVFDEDCRVTAGSDTMPDGDGMPKRIGGRWFLLHSSSTYRIVGEPNPDGQRLTTRNTIPLRVTRFEVVRAGTGESVANMGWRTPQGVFVNAGDIAVDVSNGTPRMSSEGTVDINSTAPWVDPKATRTAQPHTETTKDPASTRTPYERACDGGDAAACFQLGMLWGEGIGGPKDFAKARIFLEKACDGGRAAGCHGLGIILRDGLGGPKDLTKARAFLEKACDGGEAPACQSVAPTWQEECDSDDAEACNNLGLLWLDGAGVAKDPVKARTLFEKACDGASSKGCQNLGAMWQQGWGGPKDLAKARALYQKMCDRDVPASCYSVGLMWEQGWGGTKNIDKARTCYKKACERGVDISCRAFKGLGAD